MTVDSSSKTFLIPKNVDDFEVVTFKLENSIKSLAFDDANVYEVLEVGPSSDFDSRAEIKLSNGQPVKSIIFESVSGSDYDAVLSNPNIINFTRFDLVFLLINHMTRRIPIYTSRYHTSEDIYEDFLQWGGVTRKLESLHLIFLTCLPRICEVIVENGEAFYKLKIAKVINLVERKITRLKELLLTRSNFSISQKIVQTLSSSNNEIPKDVLNQQILRYSIDFIFASYLNDTIKSEFFKTFENRFTELDSFLSDKESKEAAVAIIEENFASTAQRNIKGSTPSKPSPLKKGKAPTKKVPVGKGALDSFFKKQ